MPIVVWDGSLDLGFDEIDKQHAYMFEVINRLYHKILRGDERHAVRDVVDSMRNFVTYHFRTEEEFLTRAGYPETEKHKAAHQTFVEELERFELLQDSGVPSVAHEALTFLLGWLVHHIMVWDRRYAEALRDRKPA
ncbi:MAG: bacteriohemerythrin [Desulfovibrionaceae bacterium]